MNTFQNLIVWQKSHELVLKSMKPLKISLKKKYMELPIK